MAESNSIEAALSAKLWELHRRMLEVDAIIKVVAGSLSEREVLKEWSLLAASRALNEIASDLEPGPLFENVGLDDSLAVEQPAGADPTDRQETLNG